MTTTSSSNTKLNQQAVKFANDLLRSQSLMQNYYDELSTASKNKSWEPQIMDNWLDKQGYQCTFEQVLAAQKQLSSYQLAYWNGLYLTTVSGGESGQGPLVAVQSKGTNTPDVSVDQTLLIGFTYHNLNLSWTKNPLPEVTQPSEGSFIFRLTTTKKGLANPAFTGTLNGKSIAGVLTTPEQAKKATSKTPPAINTTLQYVNLGVQMIAQLTFIALNVYQLYKTRLEIKKLQSEGKDTKDLEKTEKTQEDATGNSVKEGENANGDLQKVSEEDYNNAVNDSISDTNPELPDNLSENPPQINSEENNLLKETAKKNNEEEASNEEEGEGEGEEGEGEGEEGEDSDSVLEDIGKLFEEGGEDI